MAPCLMKANFLMRTTEGRCIIVRTKRLTTVSKTRWTWSPLTQFWITIFIVHVRGCIPSTCFIKVWIRDGLVVLVAHLLSVSRVCSSNLCFAKILKPNLLNGTVPWWLRGLIEAKYHFVSLWSEGSNPTRIRIRSGFKSGVSRKGLSLNGGYEYSVIVIP